MTRRDIERAVGEDEKFILIQCEDDPRRSDLREDKSSKIVEDSPKNLSTQQKLDRWLSLCGLVSIPYRFIRLC